MMNNPTVIPTPCDILCGRGRSCFEHEGNQQFRALVALNLQAYLEAPTRSERSRVVRSIAETIRSLGGRFLILDTKTNTWRDGGMKKAKDKIGHTLRDAMANKSKVVEDLHQMVQEARERNQLPPASKPSMSERTQPNLLANTAPRETILSQETETLPAIFIPETKLERRITSDDLIRALEPEADWSNHEKGATSIPSKMIDPLHKCLDLLFDDVESDQDSSEDEGEERESVSPDLYEPLGLHQTQPTPLALQCTADRKSSPGKLLSHNYHRSASCSSASSAESGGGINLHALPLTTTLGDLLDLQD